MFNFIYKMHSADRSLKDVLPQRRPFPKDTRMLEVKEEETAGCGGWRWCSYTVSAAVGFTPQINMADAIKQLVVL